jgi:hypothetical protein
MKSNRIAVIAGVVVLAAVVGFLAMRNNWPPSNGTQGAIGSANRYTAQQMSDQDVILKDAKVQAFLQSDTFHQLATNAEFRRCVENSRFLEAARSAQVVGLLQKSATELGKFQPLSSDAWSAAVSADMAKFSTPQVEALFSVESAKLFGNPMFGEMIRSAEFKKAAPNGVAEAVKINKEYAQFGARLTELARGCPEYMAMLADPAFATWMDNQKGSTLLAEYGKFATPELSMLMADNNVRQILANRDFQVLEGKSVFTEALKNNVELGTMLQSNLDWGKVLPKSEQP